MGRRKTIETTSKRVRTNFSTEEIKVKRNSHKKAPREGCRQASVRFCFEASRQKYILYLSSKISQSWTIFIQYDTSCLKLLPKLNKEQPSEQKPEMCIRKINLTAEIGFLELGFNLFGSRRSLRLHKTTAKSKRQSRRSRRRCRRSLTVICRKIQRYSALPLRLLLQSHSHGKNLNEDSPN